MVEGVEGGRVVRAVVCRGLGNLAVQVVCDFEGCPLDCDCVEAVEVVSWLGVEVPALEGFARVDVEVEVHLVGGRPFRAAVSQVVVFEDVNLKAVVEWVDILVAIEPEGRPPAGALAELAAGFEISVLVELAGLDIAGDELGVVFVPVALDVKSAVVDGDKGNVA